MVEQKKESATAQLLKGGKKKSKKKVDDLDIIQKTVHMVENLTEEEAGKVAKQLLDDADASLFMLGGVLDAIYTNAWHTGYEGFKEYVEDNFGMKIRKAQYLMQIYNDLVESEVPWEKVAKLGWTKLRVISGELTQDNVDEWVKRALGMTVKELQEYVKQLHNPDGDLEEGEETHSVTTISFKVHDDQKETILDAIEVAKDKAETEYDAVALEYICLDYLGSGGTDGGVGDGGKKVSLAALMSKHSIEQVLEAVEAVFPEAEITVALP